MSEAQKPDQSSKQDPKPESKPVSITTINLPSDSSESIKYTDTNKKTTFSKKDK